MKRIISLLVIAVLCASVAMAQEHMKFMGIPLTGTIDQFQAKLVKKGVTLDTSLNKKIATGTRAYKGTFAGENTFGMYVYYDAKTKIVYRAKACFDYSSYDIADNKLEHYKTLLDAKYGADTRSRLISDEGWEYNLYNGFIHLYLTTDSYSFGKTLFIDYYDKANTIKNDINQMEDL